MSYWFPDNINRGNRVDQLASDIEHFQLQIQQDINDAKAHDERSLECLNKIFKAHGFKSLDELIAEAEKKLSPEDRDKYLQMTNGVAQLDPDIYLALKVGSGIVGLGAVGGLTGHALNLIWNRQLIMAGFRVISTGLVKLVTGQVDTGLNLLKAAKNIFSTILEGEALVGKAATAFKVLTILGKVVAALGIVIDLATFVIDFIEASKQRDSLRAATKELCVDRVQVQMVQDYARAALFFSSDGRATLELALSLQGLVDDGLIGQDIADLRIKEKIDQWIPKLGEAINSITERSAYDALVAFDKSRTSWTIEDPNFHYILEKLKSVQ